MAQFVCYEKGAEKNKGHSMGMFRTVYASSRVIGPASGGFIFQHLNAYILWVICGIIGTLCFLSCNYYKTYD